MTSELPNPDPSLPQLAITREVPSSLSDCQLTHRERESINLERARREHAEVAAALGSLGVPVVELPSPTEFPDAVFIEDTACVLDELAIIARPGAESRRGEVDAVAEALAAHRPLARIGAPGTLDGGDVLRAGRRIFVGRSSRTNDAGIEQLTKLAEPLGYEVRAVAVEGCLHLKSAITELADGVLLAHPPFIDAAAFAPLSIVPVDPDEPGAANVLRIGSTILIGAQFPRTRARLAAEGFTTIAIAQSELEKAEAGLTCGSLLLY